MLLCYVCMFDYCFHLYTLTRGKKLGIILCVGCFMFICFQLSLFVSRYILYVVGSWGESNLYLAPIAVSSIGLRNQIRTVHLH